MFNLSKLKSVWSDQSASRVEGMEEPSEARFRALVLTLLVVVGPAVLFVVYYKMKFSGLTSLEAIDFAQIGRNIIHGKGFSTSVIRPLAVNGLVPGNLPETIHGPVYPIILASAFAVLGAKDSTAALISGLFYVLTVPLVYLLGSRVFNRKVGLVAAGAIGVNLVLLEYAKSGTHTTLYIFLTTWMVLVLHNVLRSQDQRVEGAPVIPKAKLVQLGALASLLYLTEPVFVWIVPVVLGAVVAYGGRNRWKWLMFAIIPVVVLMLPWMGRNAILTGDPVYGLRGNELWMHTPHFYSGTSGYRLAPNEVTGSSDLFKAIAKKLVTSFGQIIQTMPQFPGSWLLAFFLPALFVRFQLPSVNATRKVMIWAALFLTIGFVLIGFEETGAMSLYVSLVPAILVYAICYLSHIAQQANLEKPTRNGLSVAMAAILCYPLVASVVLGPDDARVAGTLAAMDLAKRGSENDACLTDQPIMVAWYGNKRALWLPASINSTRELRAKVKGMRWMLLTNTAGTYSYDWNFIYSVSKQWNQAYISGVKRGNRIKMLSFSVTKAVAEKVPLLPALGGFSTIPPVDRDPNTILAEAPTGGEHVGMAIGGPAGDQ